MSSNKQGVRHVTTTLREPVVVGNGQGFWGDSARGPLQLVQGGGIHYLTMDYLAEVTMSIMQKLRSRNPSAGYATDFVSQLERILPECLERGIKIIANAGGVNPEACAEAVADVVRRLGLSGLKIATVAGDDLMDQLPNLIESGEGLVNLDNGEKLADHLDRVQSANVYLGAFPIAEALRDGADIVITGRVTDPSLTVAPLVYEFGWSMEDYDKLAAATVAGHILECGTQSTGGNYDRWREVPDLATIGYPIAELGGGPPRPRYRARDGRRHHRLISRGRAVARAVVPAQPPRHPSVPRLRRAPGRGRGLRAASCLETRAAVGIVT